MPKISVWLTSYNHDKYIEKAIQSILNQSMKDFELIIVDDASNDNSWNIISKYKKIDYRIRTIRHERNMGTSNFYESLDTINADYIAIAHSDDMWAETKLEKQYNYMIDNKKVAACFTQVNLINEEGNSFENTNHFYYKMFEQPNRSRQEWLNYFFYNGNCLCHPSLLIKKEVLYKYKMYTKGVASIPDFCKWIKLCCYEEIYIYPERLSYFRIRDNEANTSGDTPENQKRIRFEEMVMLDIFRNHLSNEDFLKAFPQAKKYIVNKKINYDYAFAQILLENKNRNPYNLYGLQILYELIQRDESAQEIKDLYGYTTRDFMNTTTEYDVFGFLKPEMFQRSTLYLNFGGGFNENDTLTKRNYISDNGHFYVEYELEHIGDKQILEIRFDPDEGSFREYWNIKICVDGKMISYTTNGINEDGVYKFMTSDPNVYLEIEENSCTNISIEGYTRLLNPNFLSDYIGGLRNVNIEIQDALINERNMNLSYKKTSKITGVLFILIMFFMLGIIIYLII